MNLLAWLLICFILIPLLEIYLLIEVGGEIGALPTVLLVVLTAVAGVTLMRWQGLTTAWRARRSMEQGEVPAVEMLEGLALLASGVLLLVPGFATDALGFLLLIPPCRRALARWFLHRGRLQVVFRTPPPSSRTTDRNLEGEWWREDDDRSDPNKINRQ